MDVVTTLIQETESGAVYRTVLPQAAEPGAPLALEFTLSSNGTLHFDNRQPEALACMDRQSARLLAAEMARVARERVPGALSGRTEAGLAFELRAHYRVYRMGVLRSRSAVTDMGSPDPSAPDYDNNAAVFEKKLRDLPHILKSFRKQK